MRVHLPLLDGGDHMGVMAVTLDRADDDRRLLRRVTALVAACVVTTHGCTDLFFRVRRRELMSVAAEIPRPVLPPLAMSVRRVAVAGMPEPRVRRRG